jgi:hypothetical protein
MNEDLKNAGGKRVDFIALLERGFVILLDAKYVRTEGCTVFKQTLEDLDKYRLGLEWHLREFPNIWMETWFMVFPKERKGERVVFVELSKMLQSKQQGYLGKKPARVLGI